MAADVFVLRDGTEFLMGNIPTGVAGPRGDWPAYGDMPHTKRIEKQDWKAIDFSHKCSPIKDQDGEGACNLFTTAECVEGTRRMQGLPDVVLSPGWAYGQLSPDPPRAGTYLEDAIKWATERGFPLATTVGALDYRSRPAEAEAEALNYRAGKAAWCDDVILLASALQQGRFCNVGLTWYAEDNPGPDGWLSENPRQVRGGHSVTGCGLVIEGSRVGVKIQNHYTPRWGDKGFGIVPIQRLMNDRGVGGMWAMWGVTDEGGVMPPPVFAN